ncbi:MAG: MaoC family dehydratase [Gemmatimonadota bacterium]|nr:MaoC family dehydratase [Gemmatimonadota bacterium]MDH4364754.1 MaoC family dehydratase [Acidimicrobiia bacterium]
MELSERWFDDYTVGEVIEVPGSYVMDGDRMVTFAQEFDPQRFHVDAEAARETIYGGLIASGWHTGAVLMKLLSTTLGPASLGSPGGRELRWLAPVRAGDELRLRITVLDAKVSASKPDRGVLTCRHELWNQAGQVVMSFEPAMMLLRRP